MTLNLFRQSIGMLNFAQANKQILELDTVLDKPVNDMQFQEAVKQILGFQDEDGSFAVIDTFKVETHIRVEYYYKPTYIASAILIKQYLYMPQTINRQKLEKALVLCTQRDLKGAGYEDIRGQIEAINIFIKGDVETFLLKYPTLCIPFTNLIRNITSFYKECVDKGDTVFGLGEDYEHKMRKISLLGKNINLIKIEDHEEEKLYSEVDEFFGNKELVEQLRFEVPEVLRLGERKQYRRSTLVLVKALLSANFQCEYNRLHETFIRKTNRKPYTEAHHLIPLSVQDEFEINLDIEENIISLCSNCHNNVHYGTDKEIILKQLYEKRKALLETIGISLTFEELLSYY